MSISPDCISSQSIWVQDNDVSYPEQEINVCPRIGIQYAKEDAFLPYRFFYKKNRLLGWSLNYQSEFAIYFTFF